ncbi:triokinase/FMN cyclase-like isoform X1 [Branchiostoma floridae x Branchiostoma japonicum]
MAANVGKKLINSKERCVDESLEGTAASHPGLRLLSGHRVMVREDVASVRAAGKVTLLSGGGSGHEPAHAGYIGAGMLTGAIAGSVFTSPPPADILAAIRAVGQGNPAGTLLIVKNYTGDRLNFGMSLERARSEGLHVDMLVVGEDCALTSHDKTAGRRGLAGTVFIHKIAGALAEQGQSLEDIVKVASQAASQMGTIGISLSPCSVPGSGPSFQLQQDEFELGLGIHGEAGCRRQKMTSADEIVSAMLDHMTNPDNSTHLKIPQGSKVALMVNNLGGTSCLELGIVGRAAIQYLESRGVAVQRVYTGSFMTSLEMAGVSLTVLHLDDTLMACLDADTSAPAWPRHLSGEDRTSDVYIPAPQHIQAEEGGTTSGQTIQADQAQLLEKVVQRVCDRLIDSEEQLNSLDRASGDGDCGSTMARGAKEILTSLSRLPFSCPHALLLNLAAIVEKDMGGSSGALYSLFLTAAARPLQSDTQPAAWCAALHAGIQAITRYGGAEPGDRTMLDPLSAAHSTLSATLSSDRTALQALEEAVKAAETSAQATASMPARAGRASYVSPDQLTQPDPGAMAIAIIIRATHDALKGN